MRYFLIIIFLSFSFVSHGQSKTEELKSLKWLIGKWEGTAGRAQLSETWEISNDMTMVGIGVTIVKSDTVVRENLQIHLMGNHLGYIASPNNSPPTFFTLIESINDKWTFENKEHDFPQRIIYSKKGNKKFTARIEGINSKGEEISQEFNFERVL